VPGGAARRAASRWPPALGWDLAPPPPAPPHRPPTAPPRLTTSPPPHSHNPQNPPSPQEEGNIPYVVDNGVGAFETDPTRIASIIARWFDPSFKEEFAAMARRSKALGRPQAVFNIVKDLAGLIDEAEAAAADAEAAREAADKAAAAAAAAEAAGKLKPCCSGKGGKAPVAA
jgi:hypothetical protein